MLGVAVGLLFGIGWIPIYLFRTEAIQEALPIYDAAERRWVRLAIATVTAHMTLASILTSLAQPPPRRAVLGILIFASGIAFWFWARPQIGPLAATRRPDQPPQALRRDGAFGWVRNPLYFSYLLAAAAPLVVAARPLLLLTFAATCLVLVVRADQEERRLHDQLGPAYAQYCRTVKRLIPFVW